MKLIESIVRWQPEFSAMRRDIHRHPELGYHETRTSNLVANSLKSWGIEIHRGLGGTGVVGTISGRTDNGRRVGLRADMDALPIQEENHFQHASEHGQTMHACGHDGHTTMLLAAARCLAKDRDFDGVVHVIFQPAEEGLAGAKKMMDDGLFRLFPMDAVFGMHNEPALPPGRFSVIDGAAMASASTFHVRVSGQGSHAADPHLSHDPLLAAVQLIQGLQSIVSRNIDPLDPVVLSVTQFHAGTTHNVIPGTAEFGGTVRTLSDKVLEQVHARMESLIQEVSTAMQCHAALDFDDGYPTLVNSKPHAAFCRSVISDLMGDEAIDGDATPTMGGEDFAYMLQQVPGCYVNIGNGDGSHRQAGHGDSGSNLHMPSYDFNDDIIPIGASYWVMLAKRWLNQ